MNKSRYFYRALKKYVRKAFNWEIISIYKTCEEAKHADSNNNLIYKPEAL
jgi:hypothetical protein